MGRPADEPAQHQHLVGWQCPFEQFQPLRGRGDLGLPACPLFHASSRRGTRHLVSGQEGRSLGIADLVLVRRLPHKSTLNKRTRCGRALSAHDAQPRLPDEDSGEMPAHVVHRLQVGGKVLGHGPLVGDLDFQLIDGVTELRVLNQPRADRREPQRQLAEPANEAVTRSGVG